MQLLKNVFLLISFSVVPLSCGLPDTAKEIKDEITALRQQSLLALNDGINALQNSSSDVIATLRDVESRMDKRIQDILTYNVPYIMNLASQRLVSSVLCLKEAAKDEAIYYLTIARAELITGQLPVLPITKICLTSLITVDLNAPNTIRHSVLYTGYFIHTKDSIKAFLVNGTTQTEIPASKIAFPDLSDITVSLSDYSDVALARYTHLQLRYNRTVISTISITPKQPTPPVIETVYTTVKELAFIPPHTRGDREFGGYGPLMMSDLYLKHVGTRIYAKIWLFAEETGNDFTTATGESEWVEIYTVRAGFKINRILDATYYPNLLRHSNGNEYIDSSWDDYIVQTKVGRAKVVGDTNGHEAGVRTGITLSLKTFAIEIQKL